MQRLILRGGAAASGSIATAAGRKTASAPGVGRIASGRQRSLFTTPLAADAHNLPTHARVVVVGGGIIGNSVAYHLGHLGFKDVLLLEQSKLTSGTTWHAAGLMVTFGSLSETSTSMRKYTKELYKNLEAETGQATGFMPVGFIELATNPDRLEEYRRVSAFNRKCGVDVQEIGPQEVERLFPAARTEDVLAGFYVADDGRVNPVDAAMALAKGAKMRGVRIIEGVSVSGVTTTRDQSKMNKRVTGVVTSTGQTIQAEYVVNCAGMWARQFGERCGVAVPNQAAEHYYLITDMIPSIDPSWPVIEDPASYTYIRPEAGGLMIGLFEGQAAAWNVDKIPESFSFGEIEPDWDRMGPYVEQAMSRVPISSTVGVRKFFCGPESFTPDLSPIVGESPELRNYFVAAGLNSIGILTGGGIGQCVANWIQNGKPDVDVTGINVDRLHAYQANPEYRTARVVESLGLVYKTHYPYKTKATARGAKRSPFYDRLIQQGAYFAEVSGWESPAWYRPPLPTASDAAVSGLSPTTTTTTTNTQTTVTVREEEHTWGRYAQWWPHWEAEHRACREGVMLLDMSFMSKFLIQGQDAGECLNRLCTADVDGAVGVITYTQWLNDEGKMEADVTVCKQAEDRFMVIATDTAHRHVETWAKRNLNPQGDKHVFITDVTGAYAQLNIQGPLSRRVMAALTGCDMSNTAFPYRAVRELPVGFALVSCARITYVGELGYELHIPVEHALHVYERVLAAGQPLGMVHAGLRALSSLRLEKGYRDYGHDMDNTDTLLEVGLGFTADFAKPGGFIGKEAVLAQKAEQRSAKGGAQGGAVGLRKRLLQVLCLDPEPLLYHGEVIWRDGERVGDVRIGSYGHTLGGAVGLAHIQPVSLPKAKTTTTSATTEGAPVVVNKKWIESGHWEVEIADRKYPCKVSLSPLYDPKNLRIKAEEAEEGEHNGDTV